MIEHKEKYIVRNISTFNLDGLKAAAEVETRVLTGRSAGSKQTWIHTCVQSCCCWWCWWWWQNLVTASVLDQLSRKANGTVRSALLCGATQTRLVKPASLSVTAGGAGFLSQRRAFPADRRHPPPPPPSRKSSMTTHYQSEPIRAQPRWRQLCLRPLLIRSRCAMPLICGLQGNRVTESVSPMLKTSRFRDIHPKEE